MPLCIKKFKKNEKYLEVDLKSTIFDIENYNLEDLLI